MRKPGFAKSTKKLAVLPYSRLPWHGKLLVPFVFIALGLYLLEGLVSLFV